MEDSHITHDEVLALLGISQSETEQGRIEVSRNLLERERRRLHNKASDYLTELEMERFETASRILQVVIVKLIDETEKYANQLNEIREHLDKTPL